MAKKTSIVFAIIAGAEFLLYTLSLVIQDVQFFISGSVEFYWFNEIMLIVINAAFAVLLFFHKKNMMLVIAASVNLALNVYFLIDYLNLNVLFPLLMALSLLFLVIINCLSSLQKLSKITKFIWFLPFLFILTYHISLWISFDYFLFLESTWYVLIISLHEIVAYLFFGLWLLKANTVRAEEHTSREF